MTPRLRPPHRLSLLYSLGGPSRARAIRDLRRALSAAGGNVDAAAAALVPPVDRATLYRWIERWTKAGEDLGMGKEETATGTK